MAVLLSRMERDGLITRVQHPTDKRASRITLTRKSQGRIPAAKRALAEVVELTGNLRAERARALLRRQRGSRFLVTLAQLLEPGERVVEPAAAGRRGDAQQRIGHAAHRGHHDGGTSAVARPRRANDIDQSLNRFGVSDGGTAEFLDDHKQQILYGKAGMDRGRSR